MVNWRHELDSNAGSALSDGEQVLSYAELLDAVDRRAEWLLQQNAQVVGLALDNGPEWVLFDLASIQAGIPCVPLPGFFSESQKHHILEKAGVTLLVTDNEDATASPFQCVRYRTFDPDDQPIMPPGTAKITFTSGSTGEPKGVCLSVEQQLNTARTIASAVDIRRPVHLSLLPLATLLENVAGVYAPLLCGGTVYVPSSKNLGFDGGRLSSHASLLQAIRNFRADTIILVPELLQLLVMAVAQGWQPPNSLQFAAVGGAKVPEGLLRKARDAGIPAYEGYGLSECGSVVALNTPRQWRLGSMGRLLPHVSARFCNGELIIQGNSFLGYLGMPSSWADEEVSTGDLVDIDAEGWLTFRGRCCNEVVTSLGRNVSPEWPESLLLGGGKLAQAVVLGTARPHLIAIITAMESATTNEIVEQLQRVNEQLPVFAQIHQCVLTGPMTAESGLYTANGRPRRKAIEDYFSADIDRLYEHPEQPLINSERLTQVA